MGQGDSKEQINQLKKEVAERDTAIAMRDTAIAERDTTIAMRDTDIAERDKVIEDLRARIVANDGDYDPGPRDVAGVENVNSKNRPTQVADAYINLMNNQWLDALLAFTDYSEDERFEKLVQIMKVAWIEANTFLKEDTDREIVGSMDNLLSPVDYNQSKVYPSLTAVAVPNSVKKFAVSRMKENYEKHNLTAIQKRAKSTITRFLPESEWSPDMHDYITECCKVAWRMVVQQPQLELAFPDDRLEQRLDPLREELYADSKPRGVISSYVKAGVVQGDKYFVKAMVCLK